MPLGQIYARCKPHAQAVVPGLLAVALMLIWAVHNGGYDVETWYWGALASLAILTATALLLGRDRLRLRREVVLAITLFALYVAWSYLSIAWSQSPGDALQGSNKALLYLVLFTLLVMLPWTAEGALVAVVTFAVGVGVIAVLLLFRLAANDGVAGLVIYRRLSAPTGYFNSTAALFTMGTLTATLLATRRELPGLLRGALVAFACAGLQLSLIVQSRGWLFTLPLMAIVTIIVASDRLRLAAVAIFPVVGAAAPVQRLLDVYQNSRGEALQHAASRAGQAALVACAVVFVVGTVAAWADGLSRRPRLSRARRRVIGGALSTVVIIAACASFTVVTRGHPFSFIARQWTGFSHPQVAYSSTSHFADVGSSRFDFWRVALDAVVAHPIGGLGQDNFADYYLLHRRTGDETDATHSLELRLLAHTGVVGLALFVGFLIAALRLAVRGRLRSDALARGVAATALIPLVVWLIYGSVDWFWEFPALSAPALGFLAIAGSLGSGRAEAEPAPSPAVVRRAPRRVALAAGALALVAGVLVLGFPYLSAHEVSLASDTRGSDPAGALHRLATAADLDPLSALPGRLAGTIALQNGQYAVAEQRFTQSISRERGQWFAWLGAGLAASAMGQRQQAHDDFVHADHIDDQQPAVRQALARVYSRSPLTSAEAFKLLVIID